MIASCLAFIAFVSAVAVSQVRVTDDDWAWLDKYGEEVIEKLMPVSDSGDADVTFRSYRDLYIDVAERYFRVFREVTNDTFKAVVVRPDGKSLQQQLMDLHVANPRRTVQELVEQLRFQSSQITDAQCPELRRQMTALGKLKFGPPAPDAIFLHPIVYRIVIRSDAGLVDATLFEDENALVKWGLKTANALASCTEARRR